MSAALAPARLPPEAERGHHGAAMELVLLGTGCPQCDPDRRGPASLVRHGGLNLLVDCGSGVTQRLVEAGTNGAAIDALLLTHLHSDHLVDFYQLVIS